MHISSFRQRAAMMITAFLIMLMTAGCQLPSYSLYQPSDPTDTLSRFMDALSAKDEKAINDLLLDGSWSFECREQMSAADAALDNALSKSRSYTVKGMTDSDNNGHKSVLLISLTTLNLSLFENKLAECVEEEARKQMYEGKEITNASDADKIIDAQIDELIRKPEQFYSTFDYNVELVLRKGKWRIVLTDELYNALLGIY